MEEARAAEILGVSRDCLTTRAVDSAYRRLSLAAHTDRGGTAEAFEELKRARACLRAKARTTDERIRETLCGKRRRGIDPPEDAPPAAPAPAALPYAFMHVEIADDLPAGPRPHVVVGVAECDTCSGSGYSRDALLLLPDCRTCGGAGHVPVRVTETAVHSMPCAACERTGRTRTVDALCKQCHGLGQVVLRTPVTLTVPPLARRADDKVLYVCADPAQCGAMGIGEGIQRLYILMRVKRR